jgi:phosphatidylglycerophosphate synthase/alkylated DNA repair dioxygenase AlkB
MDKPLELTTSVAAPQRPWDARLARRLVTPLKNSRVTPNHLTTVRLAVGLFAAAAFTPGTYGWTNVGACLLALSNFLDHADGELARMSGKGSRFGHLYDLASDALITVLLFVAMGIGVSVSADAEDRLFGTSPTLTGAIAGIAVAWIFLLRMQIEAMAGKAGTRQASIGGFETEDVLYLLPLVTLCNAIPGFIKLAAVGAPLFAVWVTIDYLRTLRSFSARASASNSRSAPFTGSLPPVTTLEAAAPPEARAAIADTGSLRQSFVEQGSFIRVPGFANDALVAGLIAAAQTTQPLLNRNYIPGHKRGGSVSRYTLDQHAPDIGELYHSPAFIDWLSALCGEKLQPSPPSDPHGYALYFYTQPGDHIGWHYDNSYYAGRRYTVLLGVIDDSSCLLEYELHTRDADRASQREAIRLAPGDLVFFDGDRLHHRITPSKQGERRVSLTLEYVTNPAMHPVWRFVSNMKDSIAYFGFRQVFGRMMTRTRR